MTYKFVSVIPNVLQEAFDGILNARTLKNKKKH